MIDKKIPVYNKNNLPFPTYDLRWGHYRKKLTTLAVRVDGSFKVETSEGLMFCKDGWLAFDSEGNVYPISNDVFNKTYERI